MSRKNADVAQAVEHILGKDEVMSSSLIISSKKKQTNFDKKFVCFFLRSDKL